MGFFDFLTRGRPAEVPAARAERRPVDGRASSISAAHAAAAVSPPPMVAPPPGPVSVAAAPVPVELASFSPIRASSLDPARRQAITKVFRDVPRPPRLMHQLLSPDFVTNASSAELADLIVGEPLIAARLLATINSPMYGLRSPVSSVDQAVTLLGLDAVRALCLQYLMITSFQADTPARQLVLDATWKASALACELTQRLAQGLGIPDGGSLVSQVVLTFLGRLATAARMPRALLTQIPARGLLARVRMEQATLGLMSSEIGRLLMTDWGLPEGVASDAADIDWVLVTPYRTLEPVRASRLALCYISARLGERLAFDLDTGLAQLDILQDDDPELYFAKRYFEHPALSGLPQQLREPSLQEAMDRMRLASAPAPAP